MKNIVGMMRVSIIVATTVVTVTIGKVVDQTA